MSDTSATDRIEAVGGLLHHLHRIIELASAGLRLQALLDAEVRQHYLAQDASVEPAGAARLAAILGGLKRHRELATYLATSTTLSVSDVNGALCAADIDQDELIAAERVRPG